MLRSRGRTEEASFGFVAGCDGPASTVRAQAGIGWPGRPYPVEVVLADVELDGDLAGDARPRRGGAARAAVRLPPRRAGDLAAAARPGPPAPEPLPFGQPGPPVPAAELQALLRRRGPGRADHRPGLVRAGPGAAPRRRPVPAGAAVPRRGRRARLLARHRPGNERRHPGRGQPRLEARFRARRRPARRCCSTPTTASAARWPAQVLGHDPPGVLGRGRHRPAPVAAARPAGAARRPARPRAHGPPPSGRRGDPGGVTADGELPRQPAVGGGTPQPARRAPGRRPAARRDRHVRRAQRPAARTARPPRRARAARPRRGPARGPGAGPVVTSTASPASPAAA